MTLAVYITQLLFLCRHIGLLLEETLAISLPEVRRLVEIDNQVASRALSTQLMEAFPILVVSFKDSCVLINCNELLVSSDGFEKLLLLDQKPKKGATAARQSATATTSSESTSSELATATSSTLSRPSLVSKFP